MKKLSKRVKEKWVKALRSNDYKQGSSDLKAIDDNNAVKYCCLGVACEIGLVDPYDERFVSEVFLPHEMQIKLANFNDGCWDKEPKSFSWIASYIERYL